MIIENKDAYKNLILSKSEMEHWGILVESDSDKKLLSLLFDDKPITQHKQKTKIRLETICFIVFGKPNIEEFIQNGFKTYESYSKPKKKSK